MPEPHLGILADQLGRALVFAVPVLDIADRKRAVGAIARIVASRHLQEPSQLIERPQRLTTALVGTGLDGLGVPYVQAIALWALVALSAYTAWQRLVEVHRQSRAVQQG